MGIMAGYFVRRVNSHTSLEHAEVGNRLACPGLASDFLGGRNNAA